MKGQFIVLDGCDFAGKSTQINNIASYLGKKNIDFVLTREPGGTNFGEELRSIAFKYGKSVNKMAELLLFLSSRVEHFFSKIQPTLESGKWVICDRFIPSTFVYQGVLRDIDWKIISQLHETFLHNVQPNLTLILDVPEQITLQRLENAISYEGSETLMTKKNLLFAENGGVMIADFPPSIRINSYDETQLHKIKAVRDGFLKFSQMFCGEVIDATLNQEDVFAAICQKIDLLIKNQIR